MMKIFDDSIKTIQEFEKWSTRKYWEKLKWAIVNVYKVITYSMLINKIFDHEDSTNEEIDMFMDHIDNRLCISFFN